MELQNNAILQVADAFERLCEEHKKAFKDQGKIIIISDTSSLSENWKSLWVNNGFIEGNVIFVHTLPHWESPEDRAEFFREVMPTSTFLAKDVQEASLIYAIQEEIALRKNRVLREMSDQVRVASMNETKHILGYKAKKPYKDKTQYNKHGLPVFKGFSKSRNKYGKGKK